jgi:hypothetical protein
MMETLLWAATRIDELEAEVASLKALVAAYQRGKLDGLREGFVAGVAWRITFHQILKLSGSDSCLTEAAKAEAARRWPKDGDECK